MDSVRRTIYVVGVNAQGQGELQVIDDDIRASKRHFLDHVFEEPFFPYAVASNSATGLAYVAGTDLFGGDEALVVGPLVCSSEVTTLPGLRVETVALTTDPTTIQELGELLDAIQRAIDRGNNERARLRLAKFSRLLVKLSNLVPGDPTRVPLAEANHLVCGASNVLLGIRIDE